MKSAKRSFWFRLMLLAVPLVLTAAGLGLVLWLRNDGTSAALKYGATYEIWVREAEVSPMKADGTPWDPDGSAPDLRAVIVWQNQRILETVTDADGLIAHWQPVGLKLSEMLKGEMDAATVRKVGRVRPEENGFIEVGVFDSDAIGADQVVCLRIPWRALKPGVNKIRDMGALLHLSLVIVEPGTEGAVMPEHPVQGAVPLDQLPAAMENIGSGVAREVGERVESAKKATENKTGEVIESMKGLFHRNQDKE